MPGGKGQAQGLPLPCGVGGWACWVGLGRHKARPYGAEWVVGIGRRDWAGTRPAPTVRSGWLGLVGGIGQAQGLPLRCGVGGWDWVAGLGRHEACPYRAECMNGIGRRVEGRHKACPYRAEWVVGIGWRDEGRHKACPYRAEWVVGIGWRVEGRHKACPYRAEWVVGS